MIDTLREEIKKEDQDIFDVIVLSLVEENRKYIKCGKCDTKYEKVYSHRIPAYAATFVENLGCISKQYSKTEDVPPDLVIHKNASLKAK